MIMAGVVMVMVMVMVMVIFNRKWFVENGILVRSSVVLKVFLAELRVDNFGECVLAGFDQ